MPLESTDTIFGLLELQTIPVFVAVSGLAIALSLLVTPLLMYGSLSKISTLVTNSYTVTLQLATRPLSTVVTRIIAEPPETPVTKPLASTVATDGSLETNVTDLLSASIGVIVGIIAIFSPV